MRSQIGCAATGRTPVGQSRVVARLDTVRRLQETEKPEPFTVVRG